MVMFAGIQSALDGQAQPRKTDVLLQPGVQQTTQPQGGAVDAQPATATNTSIDAVQPSGTGSAPKGPQAARSPQAVLDANKDVEIGNQAAKTAQQNADKIAANQQTEIAKYQPQATANKAATQTYIEQGGEAPVKQAFQATPPPKADTTGLDQEATTFNSNPYTGINNALDRALALKSNTYTQQAKDAQTSIAGNKTAVQESAAQAQARLDAARAASEQDLTDTSKYLTDSKASVTQLAAQQLAAAQARLQQEQQAERASAKADYDRQFAAYKSQNLADGLEAYLPADFFTNKGGGAQFGQETFADTTAANANAYLRPEDYARLNRILSAEGSPTTAIQTPVDMDNLYQNQYNSAATTASLEKIRQEALAKQLAVAQSQAANKALEGATEAINGTVTLPGTGQSSTGINGTAGEVKSGVEKTKIKVGPIGAALAKLFG